MAVEEGRGALQHLPQLVCVGDVAVVDQVDAKRGVDKEGLRFLGAEAARRGIPHMPDAAAACE